MKGKKGAIVLGIGAAFGVVLLLFRKKKPALPEAPETGLVIGLWNPPSGGNYWQLTLFNEAWGDSIVVGRHIPVEQPMTLESLPAEWRAPVYIEIMIYELNVSPYNVVYRVQSAYGPDWPDYREAFIPDYGGYYYNVAKEQLEKA